MSEGVESETAEAPVTSKSKLSQTSYSATRFSQVEWEVVGNFNEELSFEPIGIEVLSAESAHIDPMFADYGTGKEPNSIRRFKGGITEVAIKESQEPQIPLEEINKKIAEADQIARQETLEKAKLEHDEAMQKASEQFASIIKDLEKKNSEMLAQTEKMAAQLAVEISKKILEQSVEINPEYIVEVIKQALELSGTAVISKIKVSPQDMEFIEVMNISKKLKEYDGTWVFEPDPAIQSGCVIETSAGEVDFQLNKAWERVADAVIKVLR